MSAEGVLREIHEVAGLRQSAKQLLSLLWGPRPVRPENISPRATMARLFSDTSSLFRPTDEHLSQETQAQVQLYRFLSLLGAVLTVVVDTLYAASNPEAVDPVWARLGVAGFFAALFAASYGSRIVRRHFVLGVWIGCYVFMAWFTAVATLNHFGGEYGVGVILSYAVIPTVIGLGARSVRPVFYFLGTGFLFVAVGVAEGPTPRLSPVSLFASMGTVALFEGIAIWGRLSIQEELAEREEQLRTVTENVSEGIYRSTSEDGPIYANQALAEMFGFDRPEALLQVDPATLYADSADRDRLLERANEQDGLDGAEIEFRRNDGTTFIGLATDTVTCSEDGEVEYHDGVIANITERKEQERKLEETNATLEAILANLPPGILAENPSREVIAANQGLCEVLDLPIHPDELEGRDCTKATKEMAGLFADPDGFVERIGEILSRGTTVRGEELRLDDGRVLERDFVPYELPEGEAALWLYRDVTEQRRQERELREAKERAEEASRAKSAFLTNMSHEIRTPLTSIIGFAEAIGTEVETMGDCPDEADLSQLGRFSGLIEQAGTRLLETLNGVLNLSKLEAGEMVLAHEPIDLTEKTEAATEELRPQAGDAGVDLTVERPNSPVRATADEGGVQIIVQNLISNAIKYTEEGGAVWVRTYREGDQAVFEVEDTGIGMDPAAAEDLFEPFRQASEGTEQVYEGTGVGLAVTKRAVEQMEGRIDVETEKGEGTCFAVRLPGHSGEEHTDK